MSILHHVKQSGLKNSLHILIGSALLLCTAFVGIGEATKVPSVENPKASKSVDLTGLWLDKWRAKVHIWQEDGKIVGAYTWYGKPAAIIGLVKSNSVTLRYYQAIGHNGEARCFIRKNGDQLDCEYLSHDGEEQGEWVMLRVPNDKAL